MIPKYRAWHKQRKIMLPVLEINLDPEHGGVFVESKDGHYCGCRLYMELWPWSNIELMRHTTLKDIYESDIVRYDPFNIQGTVIWISHCPGFTVLNPCKDGFYTLHDEWEIIGNIYENGDLSPQEQSQQH
jgi:hypothetical protein